MSESRKTVVVVKNRRISKGRHAPPATPAMVAPRRGLPAPRSHAVSHQDDKYDGAEDDDDDDALFQTMACETLLVAQSLLQSPATSLAIPLSYNNGNHHNHNIYGVLPCQLYQALQSTNAAADVVVSRELQTLLHTDKTLLQLTPAGKSDADDTLSVLLLTSDYSHAVQHISMTAASNANSKVALDWFLKHMKQFGASYLTLDMVAKVFANDPLAQHTTAQSVVDSLCHSQVLLACPATRRYQYWLPTWGLVVKAWNKARTNLLASLTRSHYKERQEQVLQQPHSPIPTKLVLDWLVSQGQVERLERASGNAIRLLSPEE